MQMPEELLARLINYLADTYKNQLILRGGMLLRLLGSPRGTQDLDYSWIRTKKRNLFAQELKTSLEQLQGIQVADVKSNSRGVFLQVLDRPSEQQAKVDISVVASLNLPSEPMTTAALSNKFFMKPHIVSTMNLSECFSNKIAAALERGLARDFYDLVQLEPLASFDEATLKQRLSRLEIGRAKPIAVTLKEATAMLTTKMDTLNSKKLNDELASTIPPAQLVGIETIIRACVFRIIQKMRT